MTSRPFWRKNSVTEVTKPRRSATAPRVRPRQRGFTLLELLLAIAMAASVMLTLYMALSIGLRGRDTVTATLDPVRAANLAVDMARADLESLLPPGGGRLAGPYAATTTTGTAPNSFADTLSFYTVGGGTAWIPPKDAAAAGPGARNTGGRTFAAQDPLDEGVRMVEIALRTDVTPNVLVRRVVRDVLNPVQPQPEEEILCRNVRSFHVEHYDYAGDVWETEWHSDDLDNAIPSAVRITLQVEYKRRASAEPSVYTVVRIVPIPCAKPIDPEAAGGFE